MLLAPGAKAPDFTLNDDSNQPISLHQFLGKKIILYFYPKDHTPGCTKQACQFRDAKLKLDKHHTVVIGISKDSAASHQKFKDKYNLPFSLLSDTEGQVCELYGVFKPKTLFGKSFLGIERTTFLIDEHGHIQTIWRKVKVAEHIEQVLHEIQ